jgi:hypothetical protein
MVKPESVSLFYGRVVHNQSYQSRGGHKRSLEEETVCYSHHRHPKLLHFLRDHNSRNNFVFSSIGHFARSSLTTTSAQQPNHINR